MLCRNSYTKGYIDEGHSTMEAQLAAYKSFMTTAKGKASNSAADSFEPLFFNNLVVGARHFRLTTSSPGNGISRTYLID